MTAADPGNFDLYGGLSGANIEVGSFDFGQGIILAKCYALLMSNYVVAFRPPKPPDDFGAPWKPVKGGWSVAIGSEIFLPTSYQPPSPYDRTDTVWWIVSLLRLRATSHVFSPVLCNVSFSQASETPVESLHLWPVETVPREIWEHEPSNSVSAVDLQWVGSVWDRARTLRSENKAFALATLAFDQCTFVTQPELAMVSLWGALESLFSPDPYELRFRVSANIAAFLEPPGLARLELHSRVMKLYDARSKAAHGLLADLEQPLRDSYALTKRILVKIIDDNKVPTRDALRASLFGA